MVLVGWILNIRMSRGVISELLLMLVKLMMVLIMKFVIE